MQQAWKLAKDWDPDEGEDDDDDEEGEEEKHFTNKRSKKQDGSGVSKSKRGPNGMFDDQREYGPDDMMCRDGFHKATDSPASVVTSTPWKREFHSRSFPTVLLDKESERQLCSSPAYKKTETLLAWIGASAKNIQIDDINAPWLIPCNDIQEGDDDSHVHQVYILDDENFYVVVVLTRDEKYERHYYITHSS